MPSSALSLTSDASVQATQYALESAPFSRFDFHLGLKTDGRVSEDRGHLPYGELKFHSFWESGAAGESSLDLDPVVLRVAPAPSLYFWAGRTHPVSEGTGKALAHTGAVGSRWVQNQSDALLPRVSGWVGMGAFWGTGRGFFAKVAYSPLFLPSFGPRLDFSAHADPVGSRFARLPPRQIRLPDGGTFPLRIVVDTGNIWDIIRRDQGLISVGFEGRGALSAQVMAWSAPAPDPSLTTGGHLRVKSETVDVLATARPSFPRQSYLGFLTEWRSSRGKVEVEGAWELRSSVFTLSLAYSPWEWLQVGVLHGFSRPAAADGGGVPAASPYADRLAWVEVGRELRSWKLRPTLRVEQHFTPGQLGTWMRGELAYTALSQLELFAVASLLGGQAGSHFGQWRALDHLAIGGRVLW